MPLVLRTGQAVIHAIVPLVAFWCYWMALGWADWGRGPWRAAGLLLGATGIYLISQRRFGSQPSLVTKLVLVLIVVALGVLRLEQMLGALDGSSPTSDIAWTTIRSVEILQSGGNPYVASIDAMGESVNPGGLGMGFFGGFKYGPVMSLLFAPGVLLAGANGYLVTNFLFLIATAGAAALWSWRSGESAAAGAAALVLVPALLEHELFSSGVNDLVPVALGIAALALRSRGGAVAPAILLGLSFAAKPLPAALYALPLLLMGKRRVTVIAFAALTALVCYLPALMASPAELLAGLVLFNLARPPDSTSALVELPERIQVIVKAVTAAGSFAVVAASYAVERTINATRWAAIACSAVALFLVGGNQIHRNYLLWLIPLMAVGVAGSAWTSKDEPHASSAPS